MKKILYIIIASACILATGCIGGEDIGFDDDWSIPGGDAPYGNNAIEETNVMTIAALKDKYFGNTYNPNDTIRINEEVQIKGIVTANDIAGNVYNEICVEDETGGILVCIEQGGLCGYLPVGQEILIDLKDLYIGHYGSNPQIGTPYTNTSGRTFPSRMNRFLWQKKFKITGTADPSKVQPAVFDALAYFKMSKAEQTEYAKKHAGRVMTVKGVQMAEADGEKVWANEADKDAGNGVSRKIKVDGANTGNNFVVRSSTYADFAAEVMPQGKINLTGIFTVYATQPDRYGYTWQILLRSGADVETAN